MNLGELTRQFQPIEEILLDGEKYPNGRTISLERDRAIETLLPAIIDVYEGIGIPNEKLKELFGKVTYVARALTGRYPPLRRDSPALSRLQEIASNAREISLANPSTVEERLTSAKLYSDGTSLYAAQLRDPKRGCSSSICTNCDEPIVFRDYECNVCDHELIGAYGLPRIEEWDTMDFPLRIKSLKRGYDSMVKDILKRGDWRSPSSSLNRLRTQRLN